MKLVPIKTSILHPGDDLAAAIGGKIEDGDIVVVSAKAFATVEDAAIDLSTLNVTAEAERWAEQIGRDPAFRQAVLSETKRMNGTVCQSDNAFAMLCELKPKGLERGSILAVNAGLDGSNVAEGYAIGWPIDPMASVQTLYEALGRKAGVIMSDSCCRPRRLGLSAMALTVAGIKPIHDFRGAEDLHGRPLKMTREATADQLATAANFLMGNANQAIPAVVIRNHGIEMTDFIGWVPGIDPEEDLFNGMF